MDSHCVPRTAINCESVDEAAMLFAVMVMLLVLMICASFMRAQQFSR
jgi:hypothetical protein